MTPPETLGDEAVPKEPSPRKHLRKKHIAKKVNFKIQRYGLQLTLPLKTCLVQRFAQNICVLLPQFVVASPICNKSALVCNRCTHL